MRNHPSILYLHGPTAINWYAETIIEKQADYVLALRGEQGYLKEDVRDTFLRQQPDSTDEKAMAE